MELVNPDQKENPLESMLKKAGGYIRAGRPDLAIQTLEPLRRKQPDNPDVLKLSGMSLAMMGRFEDAEPLFRARLEAQPGSLAARSDLANVLINLNRPDQALALLQDQQASHLDGSAQFNLARALKGVGRPGPAAELFESLLGQQPRHTGAMMSLADCYKALGKADEAAALFRRAIQLNASDGVAWWSLSNLKAGGFTPGEIAQLKQLTGQPRPPARQLYFEFAMATAYAQSGEHDQAFRHYQQGNRLKHEQEPWDQAEFERWLDGLNNTFSKLEIPQRPQLTGPRPVFIVSLPRSGSTLTEQILAAHPQVTAASELPWIPRIIGEACRVNGTGVSQWAQQADDDTWLRLNHEYMQRSRFWQQGTEVFTDKLPGNFPYTPAILKMLPQALVVNVQRDGRDVCWSCYRQLFISGSAFAYDLDDLASYWHAHREFMNTWGKRFPERVLNLSYEELVEHPEQQARRLLEFAGLPWDDRCLRFYEAERAVNTASASQVRQKINRRGLGHWKLYEEQLQPLLAALERGGSVK